MFPIFLSYDDDKDDDVAAGTSVEGDSGEMAV